MGGAIKEFIELLLESKEHPQQAYKSCLGILNLGKKYKVEDLEKVCSRAIQYNSISYRFINNSLKNKTHIINLEDTIEYKLPLHDNIRGKETYR